MVQCTDAGKYKRLTMNALLTTLWLIGGEITNRKNKEKYNKKKLRSRDSIGHKEGAWVFVEVEGTCTCILPSFSFAFFLKATVQYDAEVK